MVSTFIAYDPADIAFAHRLYDALAAANHAAWVNWETRPDTEAWIAEVDAAIEAADTFLLVISPEAVAAAACQRELAHARAMGKRIIPVEWRAVDAGQASNLPPGDQWIDFRDGQDFYTAMQRLQTALDADEAWTKTATLLLLRAREWERQQRDPAYLLSGTALLAAEQWMAEGRTRQPPPTAGPQVAYIEASRTRAGPARPVRARSPRGRIVVVLIVALVLVGLALAPVAGLRLFPAQPVIVQPTPTLPGTTTTPGPITPTATPQTVFYPPLFFEFSPVNMALFWALVASVLLNIGYTVALVWLWIRTARQRTRRISPDDPIFISYSRSDSDFVDQLNTDLQRRKFRIWVDRTRLRGGQVWSSEIRHTLDNCRAVVLVMSPDAVSSHAVHNELHYALRHHKRVIPIFYHPCPTVPNEVKRLQHLDFVAGMNFEAKYRVSLSKLVDALADAPDTAPQAAPAAPAAA